MASKPFNTQQYGMQDLGGGDDFYTSAAPPMPEPPGNFGMPMAEEDPFFAMGEPQSNPPPPVEEDNFGFFEMDQNFQPFSGNGQRPKPRRSERRKGRPLASAPGTKMMKYLFNRSRLPRLQEKPPGAVNQMPIYTQSPEALKAALNLLGVRSDRNPLGLDISLNDAKTAIYGDKAKDLNDIDLTEFKNDMETGDSELDKKNVRQFVNSDGSTTYEVINPDKSIMARFTVGEYKGKKVFVPGGYTDYADQLRSMFATMNSSMNASDDFEKLRKMLFSGGF